MTTGEGSDRPPGSSGVPPIVDTSQVVEVARDVYVIPDGRVNLVPNIGIVLGEDSALVVDTGMGPRNAQRVMELVRKLAGNRRLLLTITHFHPEHGFGAQQFVDGAVILYNAAQLEELTRKGDSYIELFRQFGPAVETELEGVEFVGPHLRYETKAVLDLGGREVILEQVGPAHTAADQIILVDNEVIFCGDLVEERFFSIFPYFPPDDVDVDGERWRGVLENLVNRQPRVVVPGHGAVGNSELIGTTLEYIDWLGSTTYAAMGGESSIEGVIAAVRPEALERYVGWDSPEWIDFGVRWFFDHATASKG